MAIHADGGGVEWEVGKEGCAQGGVNGGRDWTGRCVDLLPVDVEVEVESEEVSVREREVMIRRHMFVPEFD